MQRIKPIIGNLNATVIIPGSKSYTQRALVIAALAQGKSLLRYALLAEDTRYLSQALRILGAAVHINEGQDSIAVEGLEGHPEKPSTPLYLGNNGTAMRFLTSLAALSSGEVILDGAKRLRERPLRPLIEALQELGVSCSYLGNEGYPPVRIAGGTLRGGKVTFTDTTSSQFISSLMIAAPFAQGDIEIAIEGSAYSLPYLGMTAKVMQDFGAQIISGNERHFSIKAFNHYKAREYEIEADVSGASYFFLAAALSQGTVKVLNIPPDTLQGDIRFLEILEKFGCSVLRKTDGIEVTGHEFRTGTFTFDMSDIPDMVPTAAILAAYRKGRTVITRVPHLRIKESNRLAALAVELGRIGIKSEETADGLIIDGGSPHGEVIETYDDHRIAMSFAIAGLVTPEIYIKNPECVGKSFPGFWNTLNRLYQ